MARRVERSTERLDIFVAALKGRGEGPHALKDVLAGMTDLTKDWPDMSYWSQACRREFFGGGDEKEVTGGKILYIKKRGPLGVMVRFERTSTPFATIDEDTETDADPS